MSKYNSAEEITNELLKYKGYQCVNALSSLKELEDGRIVPAVYCRSQKSEMDYERCETCPMYQSRFIQYPITVQSMEGLKIDYESILYKDYVGKMVLVRIAGEYQTRIGIFIGELPYSVNERYNSDEEKITLSPMMNPAIFVPELKRIVFGCESWWKVIDKEEDLKKEITDEMINNTWYVQMAKEMCRKGHDE